MKVLIVEDEVFSAGKLESLIQTLRPRYEITGKLTGVKDCRSWFEENDTPDLIFLDIHLSDGTGFEILEKIDVQCPIVFTTAFDQYAIRAFKHNSVDYLLKPIDPDDLKSALEKFERNENQVLDQKQVDDLQLVVDKKLKKRFLVKRGSQFESIAVENIAYFKSANKLNYLVTAEGQLHVIDYTMDQVSDMTDDELFFKINRGMIVSLDSIAEIHSYFNGRLKLELIPKPEEEVLVSRDRVQAFKAWLDK